MNLAQSIRECYLLHDTIMQQSASSDSLPFLQHARDSGKASEWAIAVTALTAHMEQAVDRCRGDLVIGSIVFSLGMDQWGLDINEMPSGWETDGDWVRDMALQEDDREHCHDTRPYYSESNFDRCHARNINRTLNRAEMGDWAHNQEVANQWYQAVIVREEDLMQATTLARLSVR